MKCRICKSDKIEEIIDLGLQPLANKYPKNLIEIKKEKKFSLKVIFCSTCKCAQIKKIIDRKLLFKDYYYLSSINKKLKIHFQKLAKKLKKYKFIVDIGSNDGILLDPLKKMKKKAIGIDPSKNVGEIANKKGLETYIDFFGTAVIKKILYKYPKPDLIVASSVVTHLENPNKFAKNIKNFLKENGDLIIEIEYLKNIIENNEFERFYFDRPFYYSANTIDYIFKKIDMTLYDIEKINIHGGSIRCFIRNNKKIKKTIRCKKYISEELKSLNLKLFKNFNKEIYRNSEILKQKLLDFRKKNKTVIGYGAPARVSAITNIAKIDSNLIEFIIDDSPLKQNRHSPGKHIKIIPRKDNILKQIDIVIVFAFEYFEDIKKKFTEKKINFYKPIPFKRL